MSTIDGEFHLVLSRKKQGYPRLAARLTTRAPKCAAGEIPMLITVQVPRALFERPTLQATVTLPPEQKLSEKITASVADNLSRTLTERLGVGVKVTAEPPPLDRHWSEILGVPRDCSTAEARGAYRTLHAHLMADDTTEPEQIAELNRAFDLCCREHEVQE